MSSGTDQFAPANPYQPPIVAAERGPFGLWPSIGSLIAALLLVTLASVSTYFGCAAYSLTVDYPGLHDPSPNVDGYWPAVANFIFKIFAAISGLLAIVVGAIWAYFSYSRRTKLRTIQNTELRTLSTGAA